MAQYARKGGNTSELLKAAELLVRSALGYEARQFLPGRREFLRAAVGGGNVVTAGTRPAGSTGSTMAFDPVDGLERLRVVGTGVETFARLIADGVFPGYGGYEVTAESAKHFQPETAMTTPSTTAIPAAAAMGQQSIAMAEDTSGLTAEERAYLIRAAREVGVLIGSETTVGSRTKSIETPVEHVHETHRPQIPADYQVRDLTDYSQNAMASSRERRVPSTRLARLVNFGSLAVRLGTGAAAETARRTLGFSDGGGVQPSGGNADSLSKGQTSPATVNPFMTAANVERIVATLCRVRGAALKIGQMLSIQDEEMMPPYFLQIFERVRQSADFMPARQVAAQMARNLGGDWRAKFHDFDERPFAAASIGQVHRATSLDGQRLAVKIQYPGVADSIDSDIDNLVSVLNFGSFLPKGAFLDNFVLVARRELRDECDYEREARAMTKFRALLADMSDFYVPRVYEELSTRQVLTAEFVAGRPIDRCVDEPQPVRDFLAGNFIGLCLREIFTWHFMQTDPNWSNFLLSVHPKTSRPCLVLLDFGAARTYPKAFVDRYMRVIRAAYDGQEENVLKFSREIGFLTGYESKVMEKAHCESIMILAELLTTRKPYDFRAQNVTKRIHQLIPVMLEHRLTSPPEEIYSLHRKLAGCYLIASKLKAVVSCGALFQEISNEYKFGPADSAIKI